jgi:hypothetical protein
MDTLKIQFVLIVLGQFIVALACTWLIFHFATTDVVLENYPEGIRASLFAGLLTVGGFLLSMKTFIVINLKKEVYDDAGFVAEVKKNRQLNSKLTHYGPLGRVRDFLFYSVVASLVASASQLTIGLFNNKYAVAFCIFAAAFAVAMLFSSLWVIKMNLDTWFKFLEKNSKTK